MAERVARAYARTAALMASAVCHLSAYQLSERLWGPSPARALRILPFMGPVVPESPRIFALRKSLRGINFVRFVRFCKTFVVLVRYD